MIPRAKPPTMTPKGFSKPPMIEMAKDLAVNEAPMYGLICEVTP
jgi:hypothetical protein